jgi:hypothetical protein
MVAFTHKYSLRKRREKSAERKVSMRQTCLSYHADRFANGNQKTIAMLKEKYNRDLPGGRHGGDIQGIILRLHLSLGATAIWSTPLCEDNDKAYPITPMLNLMFIN